MSTGKVLLGVLAGVAAGAILGVLLAPDKGANTRAKLSRKGQDYADGLKDKFDEFVEGVVGKFETTKGQAEDLMERGKSRFEDAKKDVRNTADHMTGKSGFEDAKKEGKTSFA